MFGYGLSTALHRALQLGGSHTATVHQDRTQEWNELVKRVSRLAGVLQAKGLRPGDRVAFLGLNSDRMIEFFFSVAWAGGVSVPLNTRWNISENKFALEDSMPRILLVDDGFLDQAEQLSELPSIEQTLYVGGVDQLCRFDHIYDMLDRQPAVEDTRRSGEDLAAIFYTGGTTGSPKGVMLSHGSLWLNGLSTAAHRNVTQDDVYLITSPLFHMGGFLSVVTGSIVGCPLVTLPKFSPDEVLQLIERKRVTIMFAVPTMIQAMLDHPDFRSFNLASIRMFTYGASAISEPLLRKVMAELPSASFSQSYGQTELGPMATILPPEAHSTASDRAHLLQSAGRACYHVEVEVVDERFCPLPAGKIGEVRVRGAGIMQGYWNNPGLTQQTIVDGWVMTGDAGYMDQDGYLYIVDRLKDMIVSGGENVFSAEVEQAILRHPKVKDVAVIGVPDDKWGEAVHAIIVPFDGELITDAQILEHCRAHIADYKCPKTVEITSLPLPLTAIGKVAKSELRQPFWSGKSRRVN